VAAVLSFGVCCGLFPLQEHSVRLSKATTIHFAFTAIIMTDTPRSSVIARPIIEVVDLTRSIATPTHTVEILRGINLTIPQGEFAAIMGPSGSGKSTLLGLLAGLDSSTSGKIMLDGEDITGLSEDRMSEVRGRKIGFVFQSFQLIPTLTAEENVMLPAELAGAKFDVVKRARELLKRVGLGDRMDHYPVQLSGGEQQRVALARAFITKPPILLADEPTGNLDGKTGAQVLEMLLELNRQEGATLVLVTHDPALARYADRVITLRDGLVVSDERVASEVSRG
jgi:putative ABC transport system ATP-binding protein